MKFTTQEMSIKLSNTAHNSTWSLSTLNMKTQQMWNSGNHDNVHKKIEMAWAWTWVKQYEKVCVCAMFSGWNWWCCWWRRTCSLKAATGTERHYRSKRSTGWNTKRCAATLGLESALCWRGLQYSTGSEVEAQKFGLMTIWEGMKYPY